MLPQAAGIGGGFIATIYDESTKTARSLNAREWAPLAATKHMYDNINVTSGIAVAVPGEIAGYYALHQEYGKLPWKRLFRPVIKMCREGHQVMRIVANVLHDYNITLKAEPTMSEFIDPETNEVWQEGDIIKRPKLAKTLEKIAEHGPSIFYKGEIGEKIVEDVQAKGGILTLQDLEEYK